MDLVEFVGIEKKKRKVPCTACGGKGRIPFVDLTKPEKLKVESENPGPFIVEDGWRKSDKWSARN